MTHKLLIANNRFFQSGGPERYLFNLMPMLPSIGWEPVPYALRSNRNIDSPYSRHFADHPLGEEFLLYGDRPLGLYEQIRLSQKVAYDGSLRKQIRKVIRANGCRALYVLQTAHYLFPEVLLAAADCGIPSILRVSDYQLVCPAYSMFRDDKPCDLCQNGIWHGLIHRCMKGSSAVTGARVFAMYMHKLLRVNDIPVAYVCPSNFMAEKLIYAGIHRDRLHHVPTPIGPELEKLEPTPVPENGYVLFVGGLYEPKGAQIAVDASIQHGFELVIAGSTDTPLGKKLVQRVKEAGATQIRFEGFCDREKLDELYRGAGCAVVPSLWYENLPNVVLESMAYVRPVVASNIGSLPETVIDNENGFLFEPGNSDELADKVRALIGNPNLAEQLGRAGREKVISEHRMDGHLEKLKELFGRTT